MKIILYVEREDFAKSADNTPFNQLKIENLKSDAREIAYKADKVYLQEKNYACFGGAQILIKDRG